MRHVPVPLVLGVDKAANSPVMEKPYTTTDHKIMRIGPIHQDMSIAVFAVPKGSRQKSFSPDETLVLGTVDNRRRVTLFGDVSYYQGMDITIRCRGKTELGVPVLPFETTICGDKIAAEVYDKHLKGGVGTIVRTIVQEDHIFTEKEREGTLRDAQVYNDRVEAATGVTPDDYTALGEFIVKFRSGRH